MTNGVGGWRVERTPMVRVLVRQVKQFLARLAARGAFVTAKGLTAFSSAHSNLSCNIDVGLKNLRGSSIAEAFAGAVVQEVLGGL